MFLTTNIAYADKNLDGNSKSAPVSDESASVTLGASSLGYYVSPEFRLNDYWRIRVPSYQLDVTRDFKVEELDQDMVQANLSVASVSAVVDYHIARSGFRVSTGLAYGGYVAETELNNPSINGVAYDGDFTFKVREKNDLVPLVSFGYHGTIFGGWSLSTELGARTSKLILTTTGQENLTGPVLGTLRPQFDAEVEAFNRDLGEINLLPFFTIGINYRF